MGEAQPVAVEQLLDQAEQLASPQVRRAQSALPLFRQAIDLARESGDPALEARAWTGLGSVLVNLHQIEEARQALNTALALAERSGAFDHATSCLVALANLAQERGDFDEQLHYSQMAIDLGTRVRYLPGRLRGMNFYCASLRRHGLSDEAVRLGRQMLAELDAAIHSGADLPATLSFQVPYNLGKALADSGEILEGMGLLERAREAAERHGNLAGIWHCLHDAAEISAHQGDVEAAARFYGRALEIARRIDSRDPEAETLRGLGEVAEWHGDLEAAMQHYRTALQVWDRTAIRAEIPETLTALSRVQWRAGHRADAQRTLRQAIALAEKSQLFTTLVMASLERGRQVAAAGGLEAARGEYERALEIARHNGLRTLTPQAWVGIAAVERSLGNHTKAQEAYQAAADATDQIRSRIPSQHQRALFVAKTHALYSDWIDLLLELGRVEPAFLVLERERNRNLLDALHEVEPSPGSRDRIRSLEIRMASLQASLAAPELSASARRALLDRLEDTERQLDLERPESVSVHPPGSLSELQRALQPGEMFVSYSQRPEAAVSFVLTRDSIRSFRVLLPELDSRVAMFNHALAESDEKTALRTGTSLAGPLLRPLRLADATSRLLISPSGDLSAIPFAALPDPRSGNPLMQSLEVAYIPSLLSLALQRSRPAALHPHDLMAVAPLDALPGSAAEIKRIGRLAGTRADLLVDRDATETAIRTRPLDRYKVLHFASHAMLDPRFPSRSAIELARAGPGDDGRLQVHEIYRLRLSDQLVVLSACATAYGRASAAEGMQSLTRAFTHAGARAVVGTLWKVEDRAAARFVEQMYGHLAAGRSVSASLRAAQLAVSGERAYATAADWAPWMVAGDAAHVVALRRNGLDGRAVLAGLSLLLLAGIATARFLSAARSHETAAGAPRSRKPDLPSRSE